MSSETDSLQRPPTKGRQRSSSWRPLVDFSDGCSARLRSWAENDAAKKWYQEPPEKVVARGIRCNSFHLVAIELKNEWILHAAVRAGQLQPERNRARRRCLEHQQVADDLSRCQRIADRALLDIVAEAEGYALQF